MPAAAYSTLGTSVNQGGQYGVSLVQTSKCVVPKNT